MPVAAPCGQPDLDAAAVFKQYDDLRRRTQRWPDNSDVTASDLGATFGVNCMVGRSRMVADWSVEFDNRCNRDNIKEFHDPGTKDHEQGMERLREILDQQSRVLWSASRYKHLSLSSYVQSLQQGAAGGSAGGARVIYVSGNDKGMFHLNSKKQLLKFVPQSVLYDAIIESDPVEIASGSQKFENGKPRGIYGTQTMTTWSTLTCCVRWRVS